MRILHGWSKTSFTSISYYLLSSPPFDNIYNAESLGYEAIGKQENNLHWYLDVLFSDDACKVLDRNTAENLAIIRRIVYNRIKMLSNGQPLRLGRYGCTFDRDFRLKILFSKLEALRLL